MKNVRKQLKNHLFDTILILVVFGIMAIANMLSQTNAEVYWNQMFSEVSGPAYHQAAEGGK